MRSALLLLCLTAAGCSPSAYERCGEACAPCGVGYCVAGGGSGHCASPGRRDCILAAEGCDAMRACIMDPPPPDAGIDAPATDAASTDPDAAADYERCGEACAACSLGYCVAGGGSGHCADVERRECILTAADCDALRACVMGPLPPDAGP